MNFPVSAAVLIAASQLAGVALAGDRSDEPRKQVVRFADLDLNRAAGAATLFGRIRAAARDVCEPLKPEWLASHQCMDLALARAVADVNAPALTDYYVATTGRPLDAAPSAEPERQQRPALIAGGSN